MTSQQPMPKRTAGSPPALALGAMNFGKRTPADESERIVRRALERGIRFFDTANVYNDGESERILGKALGRDRESVVVATKVGFGRVNGKPEGLSPESLERAIGASLERLSTEQVGVYYLHVPDHATPIERTLDGMKRLLDSGRVASWGVSNYATWQILEMNHLADARSMPRPVVSQVLYNALHRELDVEHFSFTRRYPVHTTVYKPACRRQLPRGASTVSSTRRRPKGLRFDQNAFYQRRAIGHASHVRARRATCARWRKAWGSRWSSYPTHGLLHTATSTRFSSAPRACSSSTTLSISLFPPPFPKKRSSASMSCRGNGAGRTPIMCAEEAAA